MHNLYLVMLETFAQELQSLPFEVLSSELQIKEIIDGEGKSTGMTDTFLRLEVEVPRGNGILSRCRFAVKIPDGREEFTPDDLNDGIFVTFDGLTISYVDSSRRVVYFKANDYTILQEGEL